MNTVPVFLRPHFTMKIAEYLRKGFKVNVYSQEKQGLTQLVEDLRQCCPLNTHFISLNMRSHAYSFDSYLMALSDALNLPTAAQNLRTAIIEYLDLNPERSIQICLENFDQLSELKIGSQKVDMHGYDINFLNHLNSFGNNPRIGLLLTSTKLLNTQELYIGGKRVNGSRIDVKYKENLPKMDFLEIEGYLLKIASPEVQEVLLEKPPFYTILVAEIGKHSDPSDFMHFIVNRLPTKKNTPSLEFEKTLANLKKRYKKEHKNSWERFIENFSRSIKHFTRQLLRLIGISKDLSLASRLIRAFFTLLVPVILFWRDKLFMLVEWISSFFKS